MSINIAVRDFLPFLENPSHFFELGKVCRAAIASPKKLSPAFKALVNKRLAYFIVQAAINPSKIEEFKKHKGKNLFGETVTDLLKSFMKGQEAGAQKEYVDQAVKAGSKLLMGSFDFVYNAAVEVVDKWISVTTGESTEEILDRTHAYDIIDRIAYFTALKGVLESVDPDTWGSQKTTVERKLGKVTGALAKSIWEHGLSKKSKKKLKKVDPTDEASKLKAELFKTAGTAAKQTTSKVLKELEKFAAQVLQYSAEEDEQAEQKAASVKRRAEFYDNDPQVEEAVVEAITPFIENKLNQYEDWFVDSEAGEYLWSQFDQLVENWIYEIAQVVTWAETSGTGDVSSLDYYDYSREISGILFKLTPGSENEENIYNYLKDIENAVLGPAFEAAAQAVEENKKYEPLVANRRKAMLRRRRRKVAVRYEYEDVEDDIRSIVGGLTPILDRLPVLLRMAYGNSKKFEGPQLEELLTMFREADEKIEDAVEVLKMLATL